MMLDATQNYNEPLTKKRIQGWQAALFPTGYSGISKIKAGQYRDSGVDVVSGPIGQEKVHFSAVPARDVNKEMSAFLKWFNSEQDIDGLIKCAIAHFWFVTIHPFEDGNGRIARALTDMLLARDEKSEVRFYSMSNQLQKERKNYYNKLECSQKNDSDITQWIIWFLNSLESAIVDGEHLIEKVKFKANFWNTNKDVVMNERQIKIINRMLDGIDGIDGKMTTSKWAKMNNSSNDTALRDIKDLVSKNVLKKTDGGGRSTGYVLVYYLDRE